MLHKKIYTQNYSRASSMKKYLEDKQSSDKKDEEDETREKVSSDGYKWVKTDSECKLILSCRSIYILFGPMTMTYIQNEL